jgi:hypothetical protein
MRPARRRSTFHTRRRSKPSRCESSGDSRAACCHVAASQASTKPTTASSSAFSTLAVRHVPIRPTNQVRRFLRRRRTNGCLPRPTISRGCSKTSFTTLAGGRERGATPPTRRPRHIRDKRFAPEHQLALPPDRPVLDTASDAKTRGCKSFQFQRSRFDGSGFSRIGGSARLTQGAWNHSREAMS